MWIHNLNPTLWSFGPLEIRWYGLAYIFGFFLSIWWLNYLRKKEKLNLTKDEIWDLAFYLMLGVIIGSRLFEIFWEPSIYLPHPLELLKLWKGGMSFHGGLTGIIIACLIYCKKKKLNFWQVADAMSFPTMLALALGRIANFINGELVGTVWSGRWCVVFSGYDNLCRHPQALYAAGYRFVISGWLALLTLKGMCIAPIGQERLPKRFLGTGTGAPAQSATIGASRTSYAHTKKFAPGFIFMSFVLLEGMGRFMVDFFREDVLYFGLSLGQWFSLVMIVVAVAWMWWRRKKIN